MLRVDTWSSVGIPREQATIVKLNSAHHLSDFELGTRVGQDIKKPQSRRNFRLRSVTCSELGESDTIGRVARYVSLSLTKQSFTNNYSSKQLKGYNGKARLQNHPNSIHSREVCLCSSFTICFIAPVQPIFSNYGCRALAIMRTHNMGLRKGRVLIPVYRNLSEEIRSESCVS